MVIVDDPFTQRLTPPYYAVVLSTELAADPETLNRYAGEWLRLAARSSDFLGAERARAADGFGITLVFWRTHEALVARSQEAAVALPEIGLSPGDDAVFSRSVVRVVQVVEEFRKGEDPLPYVASPRPA